MIKYILYISIGFLALLPACSYELEKVEKPNDLIPKDSFAAVLKDMMILETYIKNQNNNVNNFYKAMPASADSVFSLHKVDSSRYISSMNYYSRRQEVLIEIYKDIQDEVVLESADLQEEK